MINDRPSSAVVYRGDILLAMPGNPPLTTHPPTLRSALTRANAQLDASPHLRADAHRDALVLLLHATSLTRAALYSDPDRPLTPEQQSAYDDLIRRRLTNEPIQYITGEQEFYSLSLHVTPAVLIPRPETEHLVEAVLSELKQSEPDPAAPLRILDVGTGSGAIAIALAHHLPHAHITATDISPAALEVAAANAARHHLTNRIHFLASDLLATIPPDTASEVASSRPERAIGVPGELARWGGAARSGETPAFAFDAPGSPAGGLGPLGWSPGSPAGGLGPLGWDAIVSNPPYVSTADRSTLHPQVRDHEPASALFAGPSGLDIYRRLIPQAHAALKPNGLLALELGHNQRDAIAELLADWQALRFVDDLQHIPRVALARKS
jgi:release factor glutamine methyltransferase